MEVEERRELCVTCSRSVLRVRTRHVLLREYMEDRPGFTEFIMEHINLEQAVLNEVQYMCHRCWVAANRQEERLQQVQQQDNQADGENSPERVIPTYKRLANTSTHCAFHGCGNEDLHRVPLFLKIHSLVEHNLYVPPSARLCSVHITTNEWELLNEFAQTSFSPEQTKDMLDILRDAYKSKSVLDFDNLIAISPEELYFRTGITHDQFSSLLNETPSLTEQSKRPKTVLGAYLMKLRSAEPDVRIASHLNISRRTLERYFKIARECLTSEFVPRHLGLDHISRDDIIRHNLIIPTALFGSTTEPKAIILVDGTYIYIQKSMNFAFQKKTYSLHKYKNLLKPFLMVCSDGYILDITGPHAATTSDATIMSEQMNENHAPIHYLLHRDDAFVLDRGFRDAIPDLEQHGYDCHIPPSKNQNATQLNNEQANESRKITIVRWVVEVINGWFKRDFKIFRNQLFNKSLPHLFTDFRIAGALLNSFREPLKDVRYAETIAELIQQRMNVPNRLGNYVTAENVNRQRAAFVSMTTVADIPFPILTEEDVILFCLGTYHLRLARSYVSEHMRGGVYNIEVCMTPSPRMTQYDIQTEDCMLLRGRISSRHISNKTYYSYLLIDSTLEGRSAIKEYYCSCLTGMRTVGACAHTVSIVWYFGICRHLDNFVGPASAWDDIIVQSRNTI